MTLLRKSFKRKAILFWILICLGFIGRAQFVIHYPASSQNLTSCLNSSLLTVRVDVGANATANDTVFISFPPGITYIPGSITKTGGTSTLNIVEAGGPPEAPRFLITPANLTVGQNITFTLQRQANCISRNYVIEGGVFKDMISIKGTAGITRDIDPTFNAYNVNFPSISFIQPAALTNIVPGGIYSRNFTITNGGNGCTDQVHFYIVYPDAGLEFQSLTLGGILIPSTSVKGDTLFFTVQGAALTSDALLCNGENLVFKETFKVKQCNSKPTSYLAGWGCNSTPNKWCQTSGGQGIISSAIGVPAYTKISRTNIGFVDKCTPFDYSLTLTNGGGGDQKVAAMYDIVLLQGQNGDGASLDPMDMSLFTLSNVRVGSVSVPFTISNGIMTVNLKNLFTSDPDGPGGLDDLDGDGFFDDLPGGQSIKFTVTLKFNCAIACNSSKSLWGLSATMQYHTMCDMAIITANRLNSDIPLINANEVLEERFLGTAYVPANIKNNVPFRISLKTGYYTNSSYYDGPNTRYRWKVILPQGVTVSGTGSPTYDTTPVTYNQVSDTIIYTSASNLLRSFNIDLVYNCTSGGGLKDFKYTLEKIQDITTPCKCQGDLVCATVSSLAFCLNDCTVGPTTSIPIVSRTDGSLGWKDATLSTRQNASAISAYDLSKALYLDTIQIVGTAKQNNNASNLHLELKLDKTTLEPTGLNKLTPLIATVNIYRGGVLVKTGTLNTASQVSSTTTMQQIDWDITSLLPIGGLLAGDSIYTLSKYVVSTNDGLATYDLQSGNRWAFYNLKSAGGRDECNFVVPEMFLVGTILENRTDPFITKGYSSGILGGTDTYYLARRFNTAGSLFQNEYRPAFYIDSIVLNLPEGYEFVSAKFKDAQRLTSITMIPTSINDRIYTFVNPGTWNNLPITVANNYGGFVAIEVRPTCAVQPVDSINVKTYIEDFYYAYAGKSAPVENSVILEGSTGHSDPILYSMISKPDILLSDQTGIIQAASPTESWTVRLSSTSTSSVPYTWIGIPDKTGINVSQVTDMATNSVITSLPYPGGNWYKLNSAGIASGSSADYRISFNYTSSTKDSLKVLAGWNSVGFPVNPNTSTCGVNSLWLKFAPVISAVEIIPVSVPLGSIDLCVPASFKYAVNSSQAGNTVNNTFTIKFPAGLIPVAGSFEAEYPLGANNWSSLIPGISGNTYTYNLTEHPSYPLATGLPGTLNASSINERQIGVRFQTTTNCDFVANTNFTLGSSALNPSGTAAIGSLISLQGPAIAITGVNQPYTTVNTITSSDLTNCGNTARINVTSMIIGGKTGSTGTLQIELPIGLDLVPNSFSCSSSICPGFISSSTQSNNGVLLLYSIPAGIEAGNAMQFSIDVRDNSLASCDLSTVLLRTEDIVTGVVCPTAPGGVCASIGVVTGTGSVNLKIDRPTLSFTSLTGKVTPASLGVPVTYNIDFTISNTGSAGLITTNPLIVDFYCADGAGNPIGNVLSTYTSATTLPIGGTFKANHTFKADGCSPAGNLVAVISKSSNCICSRVAQAFHANVIPVAKADIASTPENTPVTFNITSNDIDEDGSIASNTVDLNPVIDGIQNSLTVAGEGIYSVNALGSVTFTPVFNFSGTTTPINYTVQDNSGATSNSTTIIITVTAVRIPKANDDAFTTLEDIPLSGNVSLNDTPSADGGNVWSLVGTNGGAVHSAVVMNPDGTFIATPAANYFGPDVFSYKLCDSNGDCSSATVTLTINPVNDPPVAVADNFQTKESQRLDESVIGNDYDVDGDPITLDTNPVQSTLHGSLVLFSNGDFTYQPVLDFRGTDSFTYRICDNGTPSLCSTAIVTITVVKDENCAVFVPNSFSPNGDGVHDLFKIRCLYNYENPIIEIYNRWGNLVFKKDHYGDVDFWGNLSDAWWTGRSDNKLTVGNAELPVGTYYYVLKLNSSKVLTGFLFLNK
jgi:gliding motility-associated-like protein